MVSTGNLSLDSAIASYRAQGFSGFFDISAESGIGGLLFFQNARMIGGSYSWGRGGLSTSEKDYRKLADMFHRERCTLDIATFSPSH